MIEWILRKIGKNRVFAMEIVNSMNSDPDSWEDDFSNWDIYYLEKGRIKIWVANQDYALKVWVKGTSIDKPLSDLDRKIIWYLAARHIYKARLKAKMAEKELFDIETIKMENAITSQSTKSVN